MEDFPFLSPGFVPLYVLTGECIDPAGINAYAPLVPEEVRREQAEQIRRIVAGEKPAFLPFSADLRWWFAEKWHAGTLDRDLEGVDWTCIPLRAAGQRVSLYDVSFEPGSDIRVQSHWSGQPVQYVRGGYPGDRHTLEIHTPVGMLRAVERYTSHTFGIVEYPVKTVDDLRVLRYLFDKVRITPIPAEARPPAGGMGGPKTPMQAFIVELAGIEHTAFLMADARDEMEETMSLMARVERQIYEIAAASEIGSVGICENLSADNSAGYFDRYIGPQLAEWADLLHAHGKRLSIHQDGKLQPLLGRLQEVGVDLVNGITAAPAGDVEVSDLRRIAGERIVLQDILPQTIFTPAYSEERFEEFIREALLCLKDDPRIILGIGDMLPMDGLLTRVVKVVRLAQEMA